MHAARVSHRFLLVPAVALSLMFATVGVADAAGNRNAAHACQRGGYLRLVGANGGFTSVGQCVRYAAHGGHFITLRPGQFLLPAGHTAMFTSSAIHDPSCGGAFFGVSSLDGAAFSLVAEAVDACAGENLFEEPFGPFGASVVFHFFLNGFSCNPSYSDVDGAVISGSNPYRVSMSGPAGCVDDSASTVMTIN